MKVRIIADVATTTDGQVLEQGDVVELPDEEAFNLISEGEAEDAYPLDWK